MNSRHIITISDTTMELALVPASHSGMSAVSVGDDNEQSWSQKVSNGILVGAKWASWGLSKGAEITSNCVEKVIFSIVCTFCRAMMHLLL